MAKNNNKNKEKVTSKTVAELTVNKMTDISALVYNFHLDSH